MDYRGLHAGAALFVREQGMTFDFDWVGAFAGYSTIATGAVLVHPGIMGQGAVWS